MAPCAVSVTWDLDADSGLNCYNRDRADTLIASQTQTRYGPNIAVPRLMELGRRFEMPQTFFVPGWVIETYPEAIDRILDNGDEVALHGYLHERPNEQSGAMSSTGWSVASMPIANAWVTRQPAGAHQASRSPSTRCDTSSMRGSSTTRR